MKSNHRMLARAALALCCGGLTIGADAAPPAKASAKPATKAVEAAPTLPPLSVAQIVDKNLSARGGLAAWQAIQTISFTGTLDAGKVRPDNGLHPSATERLLDKPGKSTKIAQAPAQKLLPEDAGTPVTLPYALFMKRPNKQRIEIKFQDETLVQVYDGATGWKLQPYLKRGGAQPFTGEELKKAKQFQEIDGPLANYAAKGTKISLDGTDRVDGRPAYRLKLVLKSGDKRRVWVDAATFLDVQIDGSRRLNGHDVAEYTVLGDYRRVGGVEVPYLMETRTEGLKDREKIVVDKVVLNPKIDDSLFAKPT